MKKFFRIFDYLFVLKPIWLFVVWTLFLAGYYLQGELYAAPTISVINQADAFSNLIWVGGALTLVMAAVFILQQVMDRTASRRGSLRLIAPGFLTPKVAFIQSVALLAIGLGLGFMFSVKIGLFLLGLIFLEGYFYNFSPFRLKDKPIAAVMVTALATLGVFSVGWLVKGQFDVKMLINATPYISAILALHIFVSLPEKDEKSDPEKDKKAFVVRFGLAATIYIGLFLNILATAISFYFHDEVIFYPAFFSLPFYVWAAFKVQKVDMIRAVKYPVFILVITMCFKWGVETSNQYLFLGVACLYFLAKLYYRQRFGVNYPTLAVDETSE